MRRRAVRRKAPMHAGAAVSGGRAVAASSVRTVPGPGARGLRGDGACEEVRESLSGPFGASLVARLGGQG